MTALHDAYVQQAAHVLQLVVITRAIHNISNATSNNLISRRRQHQPIVGIDCRA